MVATNETVLRSVHIYSSKLCYRKTFAIQIIAATRAHEAVQVLRAQEYHHHVGRPTTHTRELVSDGLVLPTDYGEFVDSLQWQWK